MSRHPKDWQELIASEFSLAPEASQQLRDFGFVVVPGPSVVGGAAALSDAYDRAVATADPADVHIGSTKASTRVNDLVNKGQEFDDIYIYPQLLAACCQIIGRPFKLSGMRARTLNPGALMERLHVDVRHKADGWPLAGCILMVDAFDEQNGATRFVPGSMIIFNASVWHGHGANRSGKPRRSIQAHFVPREATASRNDHSGRMLPGTLTRIGDLAKYVLDV